VIVHHTTTLSALQQIGAEPRTWSVIRHGPFTSLVGSGPRRSAPPGEPRLLFFGQVLPYKGVEELAEALGLLAAPLRVTVAGACRDPRLARRLQRAAAALGGRMVLRLERVPDDELPSLLGSADVLVLPYRHVTTSGSALLGLAFGLPLVVPDLPALAELPDAATIRYDGSVEGLAGALDRARRLRAEELAAMSRAARDYAASVSWESVAEQTAAAFRSLL
jgi:glycosyltransferase involved in cell wall biosynthesis